MTTKKRINNILDDLVLQKVELNLLDSQLVSKEYLLLTMDVLLEEQEVFFRAYQMEQLRYVLAPYGAKDVPLITVLKKLASYEEKSMAGISKLAMTALLMPKVYNKIYFITCVN